MKKFSKWYILAIMFFLCLIIIPYTFSKYSTTIRHTITLNARQPEYDAVFFPNRNNLPSGYTELDYIESNGSQYIVIDYIPDDETGVSIQFAPKELTSNDQVFFGTGAVTNDAGYWFGARTTGYYRWNIIYSGASGNTNYITLNVNEIAEIRMNYMNNRKLELNGVPYFNGLPTLEEKTLPFAIFGYNNEINNKVVLNAKMKFYEMKVTQGNTLEAHYVPCYRNSDGKPGVYDVVGNTFYTNEGDGEFTKGYVTQHFVYGTAQNLTPNTYNYYEHSFINWNTSADGSGTTYTDEELVNNLTAVDGDEINLYAQWESANATYNFYPNFNGLPNGYIELNYISGTGTQYITTDVIPNDSTGVYMKFLSTKTSSDLVYFGSGSITNNNRFWAGNVSNHAYYGWNAYYRTTSARVSASKISTLTLNYLNNREFTLDGTKYEDISETLKTKTYPMSIFGYISGSGNSNSKASMSLYEFKISQGESVIRNYIPCYRASDGIAGLYETYTNTFYPSEGTNDFAIGTDSKVTQKIYYNTSENLTANTFTKDGYIFDSWNTLPDGTGTSYTDEQLINNTNPNSETINLYAQWRKIIVTFDANGGTIPSGEDWDGSGSTASKIVKIGEEYDTLPTPTREGYTFKGWNGKNKFNIDDFMETYSQYQSTAPQKVTFDGEEVWKMYGNVNATGRAVRYMQGKFKENTQYVFSVDVYDVYYNNLMGIILYVYYTDGSSATFVSNKGANRPNEEWKNHTLIFGTGSAYSYIKNMQIEEGTKATEYEPYYVTSDTTITQNRDHTLTAIWEEN